MVLAQAFAASDGDTAAASQAPGGIDGILRVLRSHLGLDVASLSRIADGRVVLRNVDTIAGGPVAAGDSFAAGDSDCQRVLDRRIPNLIPDTSRVAEVAGLDCTREVPVGSHLSVPLRLSDGSVYGTFCCFGFRRDRTLGARDLDTLRAFADLAAVQLEAELASDQSHRNVEARVSDVIRRDNLTIVYQPVYRLDELRIIGVGALARFADAETRGPDQWFAEAEQVGLGVALQLTAVRTALRRLPFIPPDVQLGVNVSPNTALGPALAQMLEDAPPGRIVLEITEHEIVRDYEGLSRALEPLRHRVRIAIDDAGAGYSGLRHILDIRPDLLKLDIGLTRGIDRDPARSALATALVSFGRQVGAAIVAEGIETAEELAAPRSLGIQSGQGYHLQRPMPIAAAQFLFRREV